MIRFMLQSLSLNLYSHILKALERNKGLNILLCSIEIQILIEKNSRHEAVFMGLVRHKEKLLMRFLLLSLSYV